MPTSPDSADLVIIGAGAAGLGAARAARALGLDPIVLEAMDRIGGRAHTDPGPFGLPWDRGCHWLHSADINPFTRLADDYGFRYHASLRPSLAHDGGQRATDAELSQIGAHRAACHAAVAAAAAEGADVPLADVVDGGHPLAWTYAAAIHAEWGVAPAAASTLDTARYRDTDHNWPVVDGYGALVARHAAGIPVALSTTATRVAWGQSGVRVDTNRGTIAARAAIVTVSTNVLAAELIAFDPALPAWKLEAAHAVPLGAANKVAFAIDRRHLDVADDTGVLVRLATGDTITFYLRPFGTDLANGYLAGPRCSELERAGDAAMLDIGRQALRALFGSDIDRRITASACTAWEREPSIRGAYAAARPGQAHRRADLARPLADKLFFAGEATSPDFYSTCHGAHLSGIAAAEAAAHALVHR